MARIGIVGGGNLGANIAFFAAERGIADVLVYDNKDGLAKGKTLDMMEAAPVRQFRTWIHDAQSLDELRDADVLILCGGKSRQPGQTRDDLVDDHTPFLHEMVKEFKDSPGVIILAVEPVDSMVQAFLNLSSKKPQQVFGIGTSLHNLRYQYLLSQKLGVAAEDIKSQVIGKSDDSMIPLPNYSTVSGVKVNQLLSNEELQSVTKETCKTGDVILEKAGRSSAYYAAAATLVDISEAVLKNTGAILPVSFLLHGQYGINDGCLSLPAVIGKNGVEQVFTPQLSDDELSNFKASAEQVVKLGKKVAGGAK